MRMHQNMSSQNGSATVSSQTVANSTAFHHSYTKLRSKVIATAIYTRLSVIVLAFLSDNFLPNHDADAFKWTPSSESGVSSPTLMDKFTSLICDGLTTRWDGQYFLHISDNGYTYENTLAFFPVYPFFVRVLAEAIYWAQVEYSLIHFISALKISAILVNIAAFVLAAVILHDLSRKVLNDEYLAYKAVLYFCFNPASVFFSAAYSESFHAAVSFYIMLRVEKGFSFRLALFLGLSSIIRSNGLISLGFIGYKCMRIIGKELAIHKRLVQLGQSELSTTVANIIGDALMPTVFITVAACIPFCLYQWYAFTQFCGLTKPSMNYAEAVISYAEANNLRLPSTMPKSSWCLEEKDESLFSSLLRRVSYMYVQSHYWNQGFLRYFQFKQIPQFLLAGPILSFIFVQSWRFLFDHHKNYALHLGLTHYGMDPAKRPPPFDCYKQRGLPRQCFVYVIHAAGLATFCLFFTHVQVSTRLLLSSCPIIYWWVAMWTTPYAPEASKKTCDVKWPIPPVKPSVSVEERISIGISKEANRPPPWWSNLAFDERPRLDFLGQWIQNYFVFYSLIGIIMFSNYLPWT